MTISETPPPALPPAPPTRKRYRQISVRSALLFVTAVAVWVAHFKNQQDVKYFTSQIDNMRPLARELVVTDSDQIAVVKQEERWYDENEWKLHLPPGKYRLCLATRDVDERNLAPVTKSVALPEGQHEIAFLQTQDEAKQWKLAVQLDGVDILRAEEPAEWNMGRGSSGGGQFSSNTQLPPDKPVVLFRRRFSVEKSPGISSTPQGPADGVLLWIEPAE